MEITGIKRVFIFDGNDLADPNPDYTVKQVQSFYTPQHAELTSAIHTMELKDGVATYTFKTKLGTKG